jgi:hypothetical protein
MLFVDESRYISPLWSPTHVRKQRWETFNSITTGVGYQHITWLLQCEWNMQLTLRSTLLSKNLIVPQLVKKFPALYGTRKFITAFTTARHLSTKSKSETFWRPQRDLVAPGHFFSKRASPRQNGANRNPTFMECDDTNLHSFLMNAVPPWGL